MLDETHILNLCPLAAGMAFTKKFIFLFVTLPLPPEVQNTSQEELSSALLLLIFLSA